MDYLAVIRTEGARVVERAREGPLDARVPYMARWTMGDVVAHLGGVHRWAAEIVASRTYDGGGHRRGTDTGPALVDWFEEGVDKLVATLSAADPTDECGNFSPGSPNTVGFWYRRQAHETTIHRWDVEAAVGNHAPIEAEFATDGIDELFHTFTRSRGKQTLEGPIRVSATDTGTSWVLAPREEPGRVDLVDRPEEVRATLAGPAEQMLLALWKRLSLDEAQIEMGGREETVRRFVAGPITA